MPVLPISKHEFLHMFQRCVPPIGLNTKIAVANSGGPDSTCLLFLINRYITEPEDAHVKTGLSQSVISLTVDHCLQASSSAMAERSAATAASLGVEHVTAPIPWSNAPFPDRPPAGKAFERIARDARYHVLFHALTRVGAKVLAFGHHADDQVETSLMRLGRQTTELGAGGMRRCRRWGMGFGRGVESLGWAGHEGMNRWILRPLLDVSKERILATCEEHGLEYVNDPTNFQPETTLRNAIRQMLTEERSQQLAGQPDLTSKAMPAEMKEQLIKIKTAARAVNLDVSGGREQLRAAVKILSSSMEVIDGQVDNHLNHQRLQSPTGTFLLSTHKLATICDSTVRTAMILRILRYVSFYPWGSIQADGNRRRSSIQQIVRRIWDIHASPAHQKAFVAGGGVLWTPVLVDVHGRIRMLDQYQGERKGWLAWLASRQPPLHGDKMLNMGVMDPLHLDLTEMLVERISKSPGCVDAADPTLILYDCRFLLRFNVGLMPAEIVGSVTGPQREGAILVKPRSRWYWPTVIWRRAGKEDEILASDILGENSSVAELITHDWRLLGESHPEEDNAKDQERNQERQWIQMEWIRSLKAT